MDAIEADKTAGGAARPAGPAQPRATGAIRTELGATLTLAWPLVLTNLSQHVITLTDALIVGQLGTEALAAATIATNFFWAVMAPALGMAMTAAPLAAQAIGSGRAGHAAWRDDVRAAVRHAAWGSIALVLPAWVLMWFATPILLWLGQEPAIAVLAGAYLRTMLWGLLPFVLFIVLRGLMAAMERPQPALAVVGMTIVVNMGLAWVLTHGMLGWPGFGAIGAGIASTIAETLMLPGLGAYVLRDRELRQFRLLHGIFRPSRRGLAEAFALGLPISGAMVLEIGVFSAGALAVGGFGAVAVAAHAMAILTASTTFMVPMGIGQAATARVGLAAGAGDAAGAARAGWAAIALGAAFMAAMALLLTLAARPIAELFLDPADPLAPAAIALGVTLLAVAGVFQLADGVQAVAAGALRGLKDTSVPMLLAALGYWGLGLPIGLALGYWLGLGPLGLWIGLAAGLGFVAALMLWRWRRLAGVRKGQSGSRLPIQVA